MSEYCQVINIIIVVEYYCNAAAEAYCVGNEQMDREMCQGLNFEHMMGMRVDWSCKELVINIMEKSKNKESL